MGAADQHFLRLPACPFRRDGPDLIMSLATDHQVVDDHDHGLTIAIFECQCPGVQRIMNFIGRFRRPSTHQWQGPFLGGDVDFTRAYVETGCGLKASQDACEEGHEEKTLPGG